MGCVHGKCCAHYELSISDAETHDHRGVELHNDVLENERSVGFVPVPSHHFNLKYSFLTQRGYYPDSPDKENQDSFCIRTQMQGNPNLHFFGVFDGHGQFGAQCSNFVRDKLLDILSNDPALLDDPVKAYKSAFLATNSALHNSEIDDSMSGTTAITVLVSGDTLFVGNVGDSRAVIAVRSENSVLAEDLSIDQTPFRKDEYERVKRCGARVLSIDQVEGLKDPDIQNWGDEENDEGDPPRIWVQHGMYPGTAFTRSLGDSTAESIGVIAVPEVSMVRLTPDHLFFVVASDGVFEFLNSQAVVDMVNKFIDPRDACAAIAAESYRLWLEHENRTDDITIIIVHISDLHKSGAGVTNGTSRLDTKAALLVAEKGRTGKLVCVGSQDHFSNSESFSDLQPSLHDLPMEHSPACVLSSPTHPKSLEM